MNATLSDMEAGRITRKIRWRILPLIGLGLLFSWFDKINIGFAALQMNSDLGFSKATFGLGAGLFSLGYILFAVPGTLMLARFGARRWISYVLIACAVLSALTAFVTSPGQLFTIRTLLGMAEASIAPGMIFYLSLWLPIEQRGRAWSGMLLVTSLSLALAGPISASLLSLDGLMNLSGWQWLFLLEALPTLLIALLIFIRLNDRPRDARWLADNERLWLENKLASEQVKAADQGKGKGNVREALSNARIWLLAANNLAQGFCSAGPLIFLPLIIHSMGFSAMDTGWLVTIPAVAGGLTLPLWGYLVDRTQAKERVLVSACVVMTIGLAIAAVLLPSPWAIAGFSIALVGMYGVAPSSAMIPYTILRSGAVPAAVGVASAGVNLGAFGGAYIVGRLADTTGSYTLPLILLSISSMIALFFAAMLHFLRQRRARLGASA